MFYLKLTNSNKEKMIKSYELKKKVFWRHGALRAHRSEVKSIEKLKCVHSRSHVLKSACRTHRLTHLSPLRPVSATPRG